MLLCGQLAKVQGLKGEFLFHALMDEPERLQDVKGLVLARPVEDLSHDETGGHPVRLVAFRWHQQRPCLRFQEFPDRTAAEPFRGWSLWMPEAESRLDQGESYRHEWPGLEVFLDGARVGEVLHLEPGAAGSDMVVMKDMRPGRRGRLDIPYVKAWFRMDWPNRRIDLDPPPGLLDVNTVEE